MRTQTDSRVELIIAGNVHSDWESYDIDSDLLVPADAWRVTLGLGARSLPPTVKDGAEVQVRMGGELVMVGHIDAVDDPVEKAGRTFAIQGRDNAAVLVDCSAPVFVARMSSLEQIAAKVVRPLGIKNIRIEADNARLREKINVEPGDTAWAVLTNAAEANGLWPWMEPDGTLVIGGPDYTQPPVATLVMRRNGRGNNVLRFDRNKSVQGRYSEVTVLGQCHGTHTEAGKNSLKATAKDVGVSWYRPHVVVDHEADSVAVCRDRARKLLADSRLKAFTLGALVVGHRIDAPGQPGDRRLWQPGQRLRVIDEPHEIDGVFFLMARRLTGGKEQEPRTQLTLKEDGAWVLDAHPHKNKHRRGKNDAPGQVMDVANK